MDLHLIPGALATLRGEIERSTRSSIHRCGRSLMRAAPVTFCCPRSTPFTREPAGSAKAR
jgi:hypothetical protein